MTKAKKYAVKDLEGVLLDAAVAKALKYDFKIEYWMMNPPKPAGCVLVRDGKLDFKHEFRPHEDWRIGGAIIEGEAIGFRPVSDATWEAESYITALTSRAHNPLVAAMRVLVLSAFGDEVQLP